MNLLVEVQDINEELGILKMVLEEQYETMASMQKVLLNRVSTVWDDNHVLSKNIAWVERMKTTNGKTEDAVIHLFMGSLKRNHY